MQNVETILKNFIVVVYKLCENDRHNNNNLILHLDKRVLSENKILKLGNILNFRKNLERSKFVIKKSRRSYQESWPDLLLPKWLNVLLAYAIPACIDPQYSTALHGTLIQLVT